MTYSQELAKICPRLLNKSGDERLFTSEAIVMSTHSFQTRQILPISLEKAWDYFSNPANLQAITPPDMGFTIVSKYHGPRMYAGQLIEYKVSPLLGIPMYWMTEITQVSEGRYFVDEQRFGPYSLWHHQHHFKAIPGGVAMEDIVHYKIPMGFLGDIANALFVRKQLQGIFDFRYKAVLDLWGAYKP